MPHPSLVAVVSRARQTVAPTVMGRSDGGLLTAFVTDGDHDAFAELVARFGPMVFAVCHRVTHHRQDAEDAFQAAFVILARRAASIVPREAVGNFLYGVAVRTAREARAMAVRRWSREVPVAEPPEVPRTDPEPDDLADVLHAELAELPDKFRTLLVLCDLRGEPQTAVAGRLKMPVGTVYSRLAKARALLAERLRKRGVALSAGALTCALERVGRAAIPVDLPAKAVAAARAPAGAPAAVAVLTNGVLRTMFVQKLKVAVPLAALLLGAVAFAASAGGPLPAPPEPPAPKPRAVAFAAPPEIAPAPRAVVRQFPKGPNRILLHRSEGLCLLDPDGKNEKELREERFKFGVTGARLAPDGKRFVALVCEPKNSPDDQPNWSLRVRELDEKEPGTDLGVVPDTYVWSRDGTEIACSEEASASHYIVNVQTKEKTPLKLPSDHLITGWSPDGKYFLTLRAVEKPTPFARLYLMNRDGSERKVLTSEKRCTINGRLSPDGTRVLYVDLPLPLPKKPRPL